MNSESIEIIMRSGLEDADQVDVLKTLTRFEDPDTGECEVPYFELLFFSQMDSDIALIMTIRRLEELGYISIKKREDGHTTYFLLHLDRLPKRGEVLHQ